MWLPAPTVALVFVYPISSSLSHCLLFCIWNVWSLHVSSCSRGLRRYTFTSCLLAFRFLWRYGAESRSVAFWRPDGMWESQIQVQLRVSPQSLFHHLHFCASITWFVCLFVCLFGCLCGRLVGWLFGWLVGWLAVCRLQRHFVDTFCHRGFCLELRRCLGRNSNTWHRPRGAMLRYAAFSASCLNQMLVALAAANVLHLCCAQWEDSNPCVNGWLTMGWAAWQHGRTVRGSSGWPESLHEKVWTQGLQVSMVSGLWPFCGPDESNSASIFSRA